MKRSRASWCVALGVTGALHGGLFWAIVTSGNEAPQRWVEPQAIEMIRIQGGATEGEDGDAKPAPSPEEPAPLTPPKPSTPPVVEALNRFSMLPESFTS